jgi:tRNA (guanine-N7-)-methyltransferase
MCYETSVLRKCRRMRQHVNPLSIQYNLKLEDIDESSWETWYPNLNNYTSTSLHLDLGCHKGIYIQNLKKRYPEKAFLGIDLRREWIEMAKQRQSHDTTHHHFISLNVNSQNMRELLKHIPSTLIFQSVSILFSDPWFKHRHTKRRMLTMDLVKSLYEFIHEPGILLFKSDRIEVMDHTLDVMNQVSNYFLNVSNGYYEMNSISSSEHISCIISQNPFVSTLLEVLTERETICKEQLLPIYAAVYRKKV